MFHRNISSALLEALSDSPVVLLNGARQTGKSTLVQWLAREDHPARYVTLDDPTILAAIRDDAAGFVASLNEPVILDEVQRAPELFLAIKVEVDRKRRPGRFLLTGSANVLFLPKLSESLAGRMEILTLWPLSQGELHGVKETFVDNVFAESLPARVENTLDRAEIIRRVVAGGYPEVVSRASAARRRAWFRSYVTTILQRDVRDLANITDLTVLPRLLTLLATRTGALLNYAELSRTLGLPQTTLKRYMALLETTFLLQLLPAWSISLVKRLVKSPKIVLNDTGLSAHLIGVDEQRLESDPTLFGPLLESFVVMELRRQSTWSECKPWLFHFRTQSGQEVDIVAEDAAGRVVGIEVKGSSTVGSDDFKGLRFLRDTLGDRFRRGIVLYMGRESVPFGSKLHALPLNALWS